MTQSPALTKTRRPRVLVVEDEPRLRDLLVDSIPDMGFVTNAARTAEEARRLFESDPHEIVILDLQLPGMGGLELLPALREMAPGTQFIVLTGYGDLESARRAIRLDVVDFLTKPSHLSDLEIALDRAQRRWRAATLDERPIEEEPASARTLDEIEREKILESLERNNGNRTRAALELGISRRTLHYKLSRYRQGL